MMSNKDWPAWFNGPNGESQVFNAAEDVPAGWTSGAEKRTVSGKSATVAAHTSTEACPGKLDAAGWPFDSELHASTRTRTKAGLWRMKVGVARPDPKPGVPKPLLDL